MLNDNDDRVVANVVEAIGKTKNPEYIKKMHRFLKHKNNRVLGNSIKYLWPYYKDKCKTKINEIIKKYGKDTKFYKSIIWALNEIKNKK
jgi:cyclopropane fatty-acyl-phospholipid synthase-like methyltransferase